MVNWYNNNWKYRKKITIDNTKVDATLTDFPVLVSLTTDDNLKNNARSDGFDILFTLSDGETKLKHEIEKYTNGIGRLISWVELPSVSSSTDTDIYMYYGYSSAGDQSDAANVWDSNYKMVQHMKDATTSTILDSTANNNDGTKKAANEPIVTTSGKIGDAQVFDGTDDYIKINDAASLDGYAQGTFSAWVKFSAAMTNNPIFSKWDGDHSYLILVGGAAQFIQGFVMISNNAKGYVTPAEYDDNIWHKIDFVYDGSFTRIYIDGSQVGIPVAATGNIASAIIVSIIRSSRDSRSFLHSLITLR